MTMGKCGSISLLVIAAASCLITIAAEEELSVPVARQSKQILLLPARTPANTFQLGYFGRNPLAYPFLMPQQVSPIRNVPVEQQSEVSEWPSVSSDEEQGPAWRGYDAVEDFGPVKWWRRRYNRQAVITINPSDLECLITNVGIDGLGPCKRASQANQGTIDIKLPLADQMAVVAITADSPMNTRVRLVCTEMTGMAVFTQTGKIASIADTPRTEIGYMQVVAVSEAANAVLKCYWAAYRHYTATYP